MRLLLSGAQPEKILCLTFTNAAANEMLERVHQRLAGWAKISNKELKAELESLNARPTTKDELTKAKQLLAMQLERLDSLNIHTIHSFCQKVLKQFPLEAGIAANFRILDDINRQIFLTSIKQSILDGLNPEAIASKMLLTMHEVKLADLLEDVLAERIKFIQMFEVFGELAHYRSYLAKSLKAGCMQEIIDCAQAKFAHYAAKITMLDIANLLLACSADFNSQFGELKNFFLTQTNQKRKKLLSKAQEQKYPDCKELLVNLQEIVFDTLEQLNVAKLVEDSCMLYEFAQLVINKYEQIKVEHNFLDYDDLIYYSYKLFTQSEHKDWILYKLDGGVEHILVDEAQDTSIEQWNLILALVGDFVSGESSQQGQKSIFIVGDEKQSIYSFQGAKYEQFAIVKQQVISQLVQARKKYHAIDLSISYRSAEIILAAVEQIFSYIKKLDHSLFDAQNTALECNFTDYGGSLEIWPIYQSSKAQELFWPVFQEEQEQTPQVILAKDIAIYIKDLLASKKVLFSTKKIIQPQDFLILLRQRDELANEIVKALKELQLPVSGLDRIDIFQDLSVMDLLAAAKFTLAPEDELNLACLLKSAIFALNDQELYELAYQRQSNLYQQVCLNPKYLAIAQGLQELSLLAADVKISDFFYILVYGKNNLAKFLAQNGPESIDAINELINLAAKFEAEISASMHEFIIWCKNCHMEFKRDIGSENVIRIMTVHASKGLQAPIVILPDTTSTPKSQDKFLWDDNQCILFQASSSQSCAAYRKLKEQELSKQYKEYLRLLYVAVTRSCEHLVFCGYSKVEKVNEKSWYNIAFQALTPSMEVRQSDKGNFFFKQSSHARPQAKDKAAAVKALPLVNLDLEQIYTPQKPALRLSPYSPFEQKDAVFYGQIIHKILEDSFASKNMQLIFEHYLLQLLSPDYRSRVMANFQALSEQKEFSQLYFGNIETEVSLVHQGQLARIDLLHIEHDSVTIIDYKTDSNPAQHLSQVPPKYIEQLAFYKAAISQIYPNYNISSKIIWIMAAAFMNIDCF